MRKTTHPNKKKIAPVPLDCGERQDRDPAHKSARLTEILACNSALGAVLDHKHAKSSTAHRPCQTQVRLQGDGGFAQTLLLSLVRLKQSKHAN